MAVAERISILDIGSSKVRCYIFLVIENKKVELLGSSEVAADGFKLGAISHFNNARLTIKKALQLAESVSGYRVKKTILSYNLPTSQGRIFPYSLPLTKENRKQPLYSLIDINQFQEMVGDTMEIIHLIPTNLKVDGYEIQDTKNLEGSHLMSDIHILITPSKQLQTLRNLVSELDIDVLHGVLSPVCLAYGALNPTNMEHSMVIDIGSDVSSISVIKNSNINYIKTMEIGGSFINLKLSSAFQLDSIYAETLKKLYTENAADSKNKMFSLKQNNRNIELSFKEVSLVIEEAWNELLIKISNEVKNYKDYTSISNFVITGNAAHEIVMGSVANNVFNYISNINFPSISIAKDEYLDNGTSSVVGALKFYIAYKDKRLHLPKWNKNPNFFKMLKFY